MAHCETQSSWYQQPLPMTVLITAIIVILSAVYPPLTPFLQAFIRFWQIIWWAVLLGLLVSGVIDALIPRRYVSHLLARPKPISILYATLFGFIMSVCSHGVLAIAMELHKKGASTASVITFLLASPWANITVTLMLFSFFGWKALLFILAALTVALITGFIYQWIEHRQWLPINPNSVSTDPTFSIRHDIHRRWRAFQFTGANINALYKQIGTGAYHAAQMVLWWIIIGTLLGSAIEAFVPHTIMQAYFGPNLLGLLATLLVATIIEVCSEGSSPIAFSIYQLTGAFGNAYIFLMAGVITDLTELGLIWSNIGRRAAILLPIITVPQCVLIAYCFNHW